MLANVVDPRNCTFSFPFHTGEVSSITTGVHGRRGESLESRHSVEEQSTPAVKRTCLLDEDIVSPTLHSEKQSVEG